MFTSGHWECIPNDICVVQTHLMKVSVLSNKVNLRDLKAATGQLILLKIGLKSSFFWPVWPGNLMDDLEKQSGTPPILHQYYLYASFQSHCWILTGAKVQVRKCSIWVKINIFCQCDLEIVPMTLKTNRTSLLYHYKLCASFHSYLWIQSGVTAQKRPILIKICNFSHVTLKFDRWPWKTIGHLFYTTSSFVYHFITIGEFKLELQSGNAQIWVNIGDLFSRVILKFDRLLCIALNLPVW